MSDDHFGLSEVERSVVVGEGIAAMAATEGGREFLREVVARLRPPIMSMPFRDLVRERIRADLLGRIVDLAVENGIAPVDTREFGEVVRQLPPGVRESMADHIIAAGWG